MANNGSFTSAGRQWPTGCDTPATGSGACRSYLQAHRISATPNAAGAWTYTTKLDWVFNNQVLFKRA